MSLSVCLSLSDCLSVCLYHSSLYLSSPISLSLLTISLFFILSLSLSLCLFQSVCLSVCLCLSVCISRTRACALCLSRLTHLFFLSHPLLSLSLSLSLSLPPHSPLSPSLPPPSSHSTQFPHSCKLVWRTGTRVRLSGADDQWRWREGQDKHLTTAVQTAGQEERGCPGSSAQYGWEPGFFSVHSLYSIRLETRLLLRPFPLLNTAGNPASSPSIAHLHFDRVAP